MVSCRKIDRLASRSPNHRHHHRPPGKPLSSVAADQLVHPSSMFRAPRTAAAPAKEAKSESTKHQHLRPQQQLTSAAVIQPVQTSSVHGWRDTITLDQPSMDRAPRTAPAPAKEPKGESTQYQHLHSQQHSASSAVEQSVRTSSVHGRNDTTTSTDRAPRTAPALAKGAKGESSKHQHLRSQRHLTSAAVAQPVRTSSVHGWRDASRLDQPSTDGAPRTAPAPAKEPKGDATKHQHLLSQQHLTSAAVEQPVRPSSVHGKRETNTLDQPSMHRAPRTAPALANGPKGESFKHQHLRSQPMRPSCVQGERDMTSLYPLPGLQKAPRPVDALLPASKKRHIDVEAPDNVSQPSKRRLVVTNVETTQQPNMRRIDAINSPRTVDNFVVLDKLGEGSYGIVYRARDRSSGDLVALKEFRSQNHKKAEEDLQREIECLKLCRHPSIIELKKVIIDRNHKSVYLAMEYGGHDLSEFLKLWPRRLHESEVRSLMKQLLQGVKFLHDNKILHRDLKTSNILLNNKGKLKICDFGLACQCSGRQPHTREVVTLWYRAPELLLGSIDYTAAIDMWSLGCIMAELITKKPFFAGNSVFDQLEKIIWMLGTPTESTMPGFAALPGAARVILQRKQPCNRLSSMFSQIASSDLPVISRSGLNLLRQLLLYDPEKRLSADAALSHPWFEAGSCDTLKNVSSAHNKPKVDKNQQQVISQCRGQWHRQASRDVSLHI